jgi:hypothetical protein
LPKLKAAFGSDGSFNGTPSSSTSVCRLLVPRRKTLACCPGPPSWAMRSPGTAVSASAKVW